MKALNGKLLVKINEIVFVYGYTLMGFAKPFCLSASLILPEYALWCLYQDR